MNHPAQTFKQLLGEMRPKLHRYCARMAGSAVDGEDIVRDAQRRLENDTADRGKGHQEVCVTQVTKENRNGSDGSDLPDTEERRTI